MPTRLEPGPLRDTLAKLVERLDSKYANQRAATPESLGRVLGVDPDDMRRRLLQLEGMGYAERDAALDAFMRHGQHYKATAVAVALLRGPAPDVEDLTHG
jgi:DNA-binding MarR family transcriptional regulator